MQTAARKPDETRLNASTNEEEWVEVPTRKNLRRRKPKPESEKQERPRPTHPETVVIKPAVGVSYAAILKNLKKRIKTDKLGVTV